jgi:hypothetical protein
MDAFPLNLILTVATASATIFIGFLPTKTVNSVFFGKEAAKALLAWVLIAASCPTKIAHYPLFYAFLCFAAWWQFRRDNAFTGKMWLSVASGLGISVGVMLILAVTPRAYPPGLPPLNETLLLASIYLGGGIIGLAYVCLTLAQSFNAGITQDTLRRYTTLLIGLTIARVAAMVGTFFSSLDFAMHRQPPDLNIKYLVLGLVTLALPFLAFLARRASGFSSRMHPTRYLIAFILVGLLTEVAARIFVL